MAYYTTDITFVGTDETSGGLAIHVRTATHQAKVLQLYVSGRLADAARPVDGTATFFLAVPRTTDMFFFLAVDLANANTDYFDDAFTTAAAYGNRIKVRSPQLIAGYLPGDEWKVYLGAAGAASATTLKHTQRYYPGGLRCGGYGYEYGQYGYGWDGANAIGYGYHYGYGEYGYDCQMLEWTSDPLPPGTYPVKVQAVDQAGNASTAYETDVTLTTYARPATGLTVTSYVSGTNTLTLSYTESKDVT